ncbi:MAG TPA: DUF3822 family protein [Bacteroidales bacterium]|jgi:hypothetical protein|nr:DUF3822 family protein [Bacteroidales bacterium]
MTSLELFDETLDINSTENYELAIQASPGGFAFCLLDTLRNKIVLVRSSEPETGKYFNSETIKEFVSKDDFLARPYRKTRIVLPSPKITLVPAPLFDPAKKDEYFSLNLGKDNNFDILSNRTPDPDMFIVFGVPVSIHEVIRSLYPVVHPYVHLVPLLHNIEGRRSAHGSYIHIHIEKEFFNLIIFRDNQLQFCNTFRHRSFTDILYYVLNAFGKLGINREEAICMSGLCEKQDDLSSALAEYIPDIRYAVPKGNFSFSYVFGEISLHRFINLFSVFNCG